MNPGTLLHRDSQSQNRTITPTAPAEPPTHSRFLLWSTPIIMPRPMRTSGSTGVSSPPSGHTNIMRISICVGPCGV